MKGKVMQKVWHEKDGNGNRTGRTIAVVKDGNTVGVGISVCSDKDQFNKKLGFTIATSRAKHAVSQLYGANGVRPSSVPSNGQEYPMHFTFYAADPNEYVEKANIPSWLYTFSKDGNIAV